MTKKLQAAKLKRYVGVAELAAEAASIIQEVAPVQDRGTVTEVPDERTVRYYLTEGLISPAEEKQGAASVFTYRQLLQLLAIKKLQAEHISIRNIRDLVADRPEDELERIVGVTDAEPEQTKNEALRYLEGLLTNPRPAGLQLPNPQLVTPGPTVPPVQAFKAQNRERHGSQPENRTIAGRASGQRAQTPAPPNQAVPMAPMAGSLRPGAVESEAVGPGSGRAELPPAAPAQSSIHNWARVEIEPGLELLVRDDYKSSPEGQALRSLARVIIDVIQSITKKSTE